MLLFMLTYAVIEKCTSCLATVKTYISPSAKLYLAKMVNLSIFW
ncbi:20S proteasome core particle subunit beta 4 [Giardia duodenalis assemblage B]|uniref:20S proteasome core particle subunit beta 4 n=1 Tax=Giardia duodenalis assemblage B TaxID=1394984 RepID=A0A132NNL7_GIAIN|nr:20S proteasome core particle subunit beta 4 [Giardia intestinalis assemblage B]